VLNKYYRDASKFGRKAEYSWVSWITIIVALGLILTSLLQLIYRYSLPTDGWYITYTNPSENSWTYLQNLVGAPSQLQPADKLVAVEGNILLRKDNFGYFTKSPNWQIGKEINITVQRQGQKLSFSVPVVNWTTQALKTSIFHNTEISGGLLSALVITILSLFTFLKRPDIPAARILLILSGAYAANVISTILPGGISTIFNPISFYSVTFFNYGIFAGLLSPSILAFTLVFPRPKQIIEQKPWLVLFPYIFGVIISITILFGASLLIGWISTFAMIALAIISLIHNAFTMRDAISRAQLSWAIVGTILGLLLSILVFPLLFNLLPESLAQFESLGTTLGFALIALSLSIAILRYRLFDIDVIIRRTVQYGLITVLLAAIYFGCVVLLQNILTSITGQESPIVIVISTLAVAALFNPLRLRVQKAVDRRFFRKKYNAAITLENFNSVIRHEVELDKLESQIARIIIESLEPEIFSIWIKKN
jgi:hypothetical protein